MREIRTDVEIAAPIEKVWGILTDFDQWREWNPIVAHISGKAVTGGKIHITMRSAEGKDGNKYIAVVRNADEPKSLSWRAVMIAGFLFSNDKNFELEEIGYATRLIHIEAFKGIFLPLFWKKLDKFVPPMLKSMNDALKIEAEKA